MSEILMISGLKGGYKENVNVLKGVDLSVNEGETIGIIGLNGSGKSTLGKAIMNMIPFREGRISFDGEDISGLSTYALARKGLSLMQQGGRVFENLSVWDNLALAFPDGMAGKTFDLLQGVVPMLQKPRRVLQHQMADKLSGGEKHHLALVMALAAKPKLVILDEPSAGLSPIATEEMYRILKSVQERMDTTIVLIEQNYSRAVAFSKKTVLIRNGVFAGTFSSADTESIEKQMFHYL